jgi:transcriptional regulator with XRE-family HTH domain
MDYHVGARIRQRRILIGLSQHHLAEMIGVTYQQAHKYEKGVNRISAGRLYTIAQALGVDINFFFEGLGDNQTVETTPQGRLLLDLARNFASLTDRRHQEALSDLVRVVADNSADDDSSPETKPDPDWSAS